MMESFTSLEMAEQPAMQIAGFDSTRISYAVDASRRIQEKMPAYYSPMARFFASMYPFAHVFMLERWDWKTLKHRDGMAGMVPYPREAFLLIHLAAHLGTIGSYRQACREIEKHDDWRKALKLKQVPDHTTLSKFRTETGPGFFKEFFSFSIAILKHLGALDGDQELIVDSAPIEAYVNLARANKRIEIDEARIIDFFTRIHLDRIDEVFPRKRKGAFKASSLVGLLLIYHLCRFLSKSQMLREVAKHAGLMQYLGFEDVVPSLASLTYFVKTNGSDEKVLFEPLIDAIAGYFGENGQGHDMIFFFRSIGQAECIA